MFQYRRIQTDIGKKIIVIILRLKVITKRTKIPAGETLLDLLRSFELLAGDTAMGSFELILRRGSRGVSGTGVAEVL